MVTPVRIQLGPGALCVTRHGGSHQDPSQVLSASNIQQILRTLKEHEILRRQYWRSQPDAAPWGMAIDRLAPGQSGEGVPLHVEDKGHTQGTLPTGALRGGSSARQKHPPLG